MEWYHYLALTSLGVCVAASFVHALRLIRLGKPADFAPPAGEPAGAIIYSMTGAMSPAKKESAYLHMPTYTAGIIYHMGTFLAILLFFLILLNIIPTGLIGAVISAVLILSALCGAGILVKRMIKPGLRGLSNPDDYISNILVTLFQAATVTILWMPATIPLYFVSSSLLLLYFPVGKLKHAIYFFAARYHLGVFYGSRGVWPPRTR